MNMFWSAVLKIRNVKVVSCCNMHTNIENSGEISVRAFIFNCIANYNTSYNVIIF